MATQTTLSPWDRITALATLGLQHNAPDLKLLWPDVSLIEFTDESESKTLLRAAAAIYLWNLAGVRSGVQEVTTVATPFPVTEKACASEAAAWYLTRMLNGDNADLVPEWFELATKAGKTLPPHWLPVVLDRISIKLRNQYTAVLGEGAVWLAARNPKWAIRSEALAPSMQRWSEGSLEERRVELKAIRLTDPAMGLSWLRSTWDTEEPEAREAFLEVLLVGLTIQDESFLESALDDKRKSVRVAAVDCLARLPQSAHAQRNIERLKPLLTIEEQKSGLLAKFRKRKLEVQLPAALDKASQRDGIEVKPPINRKLGERAYWLAQMVSMVDPAQLQVIFQCDPTTIVQAVVASEFADELLLAFVTASNRHPHSEWIAALCDAWVDSKKDTQLTLQTLNTLIGSAPCDERAALLESLLSRLPENDRSLAFALLGATEIPWTETMTTIAMDILRNSVRTQTQQWSVPRTALDNWARRCDVSVAISTLSDLIECCAADSSWRGALENMNEVVAFRAAMKQELLT